MVRLFNPDSCPIRGMVIVNCLKDCEHATTCIERSSPADIILRVYLDSIPFEDRVKELSRLVGREGYGMRTLLAFNDSLSWTVNELSEHVGMEGQTAANWLNFFLKIGLVKLKTSTRRGNRYIYYVPVDGDGEDMDWMKFINRYNRTETGGRNSDTSYSSIYGDNE